MDYLPACLPAWINLHRFSLSTIDQSDDTAYNELADEEGFRSIGAIDVDLEDAYGLSTVVIKLSVPEDERRSSDAVSTLLISDAAALERVE